MIFDAAKKLALDLYAEIRRICTTKAIEAGCDEWNSSSQNLNCTITNGEVSLILEPVMNFIPVE